ncbi:MAG TPA: MlaD family protein [Thermoleophilaceae bacterium]|nr:MlaD family protein [Thermoleophilaceae bacterium]
MGALVVLVALLALAVLGRGGNYEVKATFENAGQLVEGNQVRIGGAPVGRINDIGLDNKGNAVVTMSVEDRFEPLHEGTVATIRATSLSGIANRYVSIQPGPNNAREIADGQAIGVDKTSAPVDLDVLFNTLDKDTREGLRNLIRGTADQYNGRVKEAGESTTYFNPFLVSTTQLTRELALDQEVFQRFVTDTANTVSAIAERRDDLAGLVSNTNTAMKAIGDESAALDRALAALPDTLRKANTTFVNLRPTLDDLDVLVNESKPATKDLARFVRELRPVVSAARPTVSDLRTLIRQPGQNNDLIELTAKQPRLARLTASVFPRAVRTLDEAQPVIDYARQYTPDFAAWFTKFGQVPGYYDANGHYAKVQPIFSPANYDAATNSLRAVPPLDRLNGFEKGVLTPCPGGAVQPSPDRSTPQPAEGCDPGDSPPGP